jgi:hypothetical protein
MVQTLPAELAGYGVVAADILNVATSRKSFRKELPVSLAGTTGPAHNDNPPLTLTEPEADEDETSPGRAS